MRRRAMIHALGVGVVAGTGGCAGGGEVIEELHRSERVEPGRYWSHELPDVGDTGGGVSYVARAGRAFDVYFFTHRGDFQAYRSGVDGQGANQPPAGHEALSKTAVPTGDGETFEAATADGGARQSLSADGPYFFVLDHTDYGVGARPGDPGEPLTVSLDLTLVRNRFF